MAIRVVAPLIWYPLLVLTLLVVARFSVIYNWTWPPGLVLSIGITAAWALGSAMLLRRAAKHLRETALNDLRRFRLLGQESDVKRQAFDELMAEIRDLKTGAFAPLSDQPFVRAVLFAGAGLGLLAVAQRLLGIFEASQLEFSCQTFRPKLINVDSVKVMPPARGHLLRLSRVGPCVGMCVLLVFASCEKNPIDEAKAAGKSTADFPQITADVFKPMDGGIELSAEEIIGRNTWNLWSGGNEQFWDHAARGQFRFDGFAEDDR